MTNLSTRRGRRILIASEKVSMILAQHAAWQRHLKKDSPPVKMRQGWQQHHPDDEVSFIFVSPFGTRQLDVPRDLPLSQVPVLSEPRWKLDTPQPSATGKIRRVSLDLPSALSQADVLICATDDDYGGTFNFVNLLRHHGIPLTDDIMRWRITSLVDADLDRSLQEMVPITHPDVMLRVRQGEARRYFDYNYAINALPVLGMLLGRAGTPTPANFVSKNGLQMIQYLVREDASPMTREALMRLMSAWPGSGKYGAHPMGSSMSHAKIIDDLRDAGLLQVLPDVDDQPLRIEVTTAARAFVASLHRGMRDPDLPYRMARWADEWPSSKPSMDTYLRTMWGRQKRGL
jgi:hypothetical protein